MKNLKDKTLALFFTCGVSLETWRKIGNLEREIKPYNKLAQYFKKIYFITYEGKSELNFKGKLSENIEILVKNNFLPSVIYQFFIPFVYRRELKETDIYKTNQMASAIPALISKWLYRKKLIIRCGYELLEFLEKMGKSFWKRITVFFIEKVVYKYADKIILTSAKDKKFVEKKFNKNFFKIEIIPNYIDAELFKPLKIDKDKSRVIFIGRFNIQKNIIKLVEAVSESPFKLVIIGCGHLGKEIEYMAIKKRANVEFKENIPNEKLPEELSRSEIFVLPSLYEGCPKALLEAMSCALPCIGTDVEGIREIILHKNNGYLCGTDADSIKKAIIEISQDKNLQKKIGARARQTILENFNLEKILKKETDIYEVL